MALEETIIQLKHMGKEFKTANAPVKALDDINLEIRRGEIFGIIGLSGAGKSTLVRCINMLEIPTSGQVLFEGENLAALNDAGQRKARQSMGMIFQQFNLLPHGDCGSSEAAGKGTGHGAVEACGTGGPGKGLSGTAFRRTAPESSHCPGYCNKPEGAFV